MRFIMPQVKSRHINNLTWVMIRGEPDPGAYGRMFRLLCAGRGRVGMGKPARRMSERVSYIWLRGQDLNL